MEPPEYNPSIFFGYALDMIFLVCCLFFCYRKSSPKMVRLIRFFAYSNAIIDIITLSSFLVKEDKYLSLLKLIDNLAFMFAFLFEIVFFTFLLFQVVQSKLAKRISWLFNSFAFICMFFVVFYIIQHNKHSLIDYSLSLFTILQAVSILMLCVVFFSEMIKTKQIKGWINLQTYWVVTGIFFYFLLRIPTFLFLLYFVDQNKIHLGNTIVSVYNYSQIIPYAFFIRAITLKTGKQLLQNLG